MTGLKREKIAVLGGGSWGTSLANMLSSDGHDVSMWAFEKDLVERMRQTRVNDIFLPAITLPETLRITNDMEEALSGRDIVVSMGPSAYTRQVCSQAAEFISDGSIILNAAKGLEPKTLKRMSEVLGEVFPKLSPDGIATLSGPTFALELARRRPTAALVGCKSLDTARRFQEMLSCSYFRLYTSEDIVGVEFGGALKNIVAIASGIVDGLGLGPNTQAALITRGLSEIARLGAANGAKPLTFQGLSGLGDLVLTCMSKLSRNYSLGYELAQGRKLKDILSEMKMVAEGVGTCRSALQLSKMCNVEMPITAQMFEVLFENKSPGEAIQDLMNRPLKEELN
ncbi:MAG: NAD(P)-dependent glycerol-3-phosphate dehydrogenase [Candidatus Coatesbacteria bacterium]|nr:NAD(P)-dependent glycerol-3-phosphate dehydrogenase [Candidatus Coatesbacteria bacterium]